METERKLLTMKPKKTDRLLSQMFVITLISFSVTSFCYADKNKEEASSSKVSSSATQLSGLIQTTAGFTSLQDTQVDARPLLSVYRARFWLKGQVSPIADYILHLAFDRIGADEFALLQGKPLSKARSLAVQDAMLHFHLLPKRGLVLTSGFLRPSVGRENNTLVITLPSIEPALSASLVRQATAEIGHGRMGGFNLGHHSRFGSSSLQLHFSVSMPSVEGDSDPGTEESISYTQSQGVKLSPLYAGTLQLNWGPLHQMGNQGMLTLINPFKKARAFHIGVSGSHQGETERFAQSQVMTAYAYAHLDDFMFDGEWVSAARETLSGNSLENSAWHVRAAYNFNMAQRILTPFVVYSQLRSSMYSDEEWTNGLSALNLFRGEGSLIDAGAHFHFAKRKFRLGLHGIVSSLGESQSSKLPLKAGKSALMTFHMHL